MARPNIKMNRKGMRQLLRSTEVVEDLERRAQAIAAAAGPGHRVYAGAGRNRARATVLTETVEAKVAEAKTRNLTRAIDAGRG